MFVLLHYFTLSAFIELKFRKLETRISNLMFALTVNNTLLSGVPLPTSMNTPKSLFFTPNVNEIASLKLFVLSLTICTSNMH